MRQKVVFQPDESQRRVIDADGGYHLVLAPPGCGKTQILTERIRRAHACGVPYEQMLCLTFTNRAARGMVERIRENIEDHDVTQVYVGNVHRFCSKFLFENNIIPAETSIIDDEDAVSIVARYLDEDEMQVMESQTRRREYFDMIHFSHFMQQLRSGQPRELRLHPESCNADDVSAMKKICEVQRMSFDASAILDIYDHTDHYLTVSRMEGYDLGSQVIIDRLLRKMTVARQYEQYKRENRLVDFEDLLIMAYDTMSPRYPVTQSSPITQPPSPTTQYQWIQVDEVQDLNPLQLAIIDLITADGATVMYLGDEQQAIFSFMGARLSTLEMLRQRCQRNIHHLSTNHRSPRYLLEVYNEYARTILGIDEAFLPKAAAPPRPSPQGEEIKFRLAAPSPLGESRGGALRILRSNTLDTEYYDVAHVAGNFLKSSPDETTAIIVNANADADLIGSELEKLQFSYFKVSGEDLFTTREVKMLLAHLSLLSNEHNFIAWARLLRGMGVMSSNAYARNFVQSLRMRAMLPSDFLCYDGTTYIEQFVRTYESEEIVVFDTETTGLDVCEDDIVQIAAVRLRQGQVVAGSEFNVFLQTSREIPAMLGDTPNPLIEELRHHQQLPPTEGLQQFLDYVGNRVLLGHNAQYDYQILLHNLKRAGLLTTYQSTPSSPSPFGEGRDGAPPFDTLKVIRLLAPELKQYKLKYLLAVLSLEGENSHLADADVSATCSLVRYCYEKAKMVIPQQHAFMQQQRVQERVKVLRRQYQSFYIEALAKLNETSFLSEDGQSENPLVTELLRFHDYLVTNGMISPVRKLHDITCYLNEEMLNPEVEHTLSQQLAAHIVEMNTLKEADLCNSRSIADRIFVTTVHKAKGLEFDNVIVFDAVEDRYPSYFNRNSPTGIAEDARKFYVALTRAKKRLYVSQCLTRIDWHNQPRDRKLTRFMNPIMKFFS